MAGINGFPGTTFENIVKGETLPFTLYFKNDDGSAKYIAGYTALISFSSALDCEASGNAIETRIYVTDPVGGVISGEIPDTITATMPVGDIYASVKYIKPDGRAYMIDMALVQVNPCVSTNSDV